MFNVYLEDSINRALSEYSIGIKINGVIINNLRYADDTVLIAETLEDLQSLVNRIVRFSEEYGLSLNTTKKKFILLSKSTQTAPDIFIHDQPSERVRKYNYLDTVINENDDSTEEVRIRIEKARAIFMKMKRVFGDRDLGLELKIRFMRRYVLLVLFYGMEAWALRNIDTKKAFELWMYGRMLRISWVNKVTNVEILRRMHKEKSR